MSLKIDTSSHSQKLAQHLHQVIFGGNWTDSNLSSQLEDIDYKIATTQFKNLNSIAALTYHIGYYFEAILSVLKAQGLEARDKYSFDHPDINDEEDWQKLKASVLSNATELCKLIETMEDIALRKIFVDEKYGDYLRNFMGVIEHSHYHLGQIAIIKKLIKTE